MRRRSGSNMDAEIFSKINANAGPSEGLTRADIHQITARFKQADNIPGHGISIHDMVAIIRNTGVEVNDDVRGKIIKEIEDSQAKEITLETVFMAIGIAKKQMEKIDEHEENQESEMLDAFVALGGNTDGSGVVSKKYLLDVIKGEFELSVDIEAMIESLKLGVVDSLDFDAFCALFSADLQKKRSMVSLISNKSHNALQVPDYNEFESYLKRIEGKYD